MLSPVRPECIFKLRMSPAPRNKPNAFDIVGAAAIVVAAKALIKPRRVTLDALEAAICHMSRFCPRRLGHDGELTTPQR